MSKVVNALEKALDISRKASTKTAAAAVGLGAAGASEESEAGPVRVLSHIDDAGKKVYKTVVEAWHGSPHKFDKFSMDNIGTGEGAQAYGHGLYFADEKDVAKGYQPRSFDAEEVMLDRYKQAERAEDYEAMEVWEAAMMHETPADIIQRYNPKEYGDEMAAKAKQIADDLSEMPSEGSLLRTHLDVDPDSLLDWDKPLSEQSESVREAVYSQVRAQPDWQDYYNSLPDEVKPLADEMLTGSKEFLFDDSFDRWKALDDAAPDLDHNIIHDTRQMWNLDDNPTGSQLYADFNRGGLSPERASEWLRDDYGIPGIRYLDGASRSHSKVKSASTTPVDGGFSVRVDDINGASHDLGTFPTQEAADSAISDYRYSGGSSNYVMFDDKPISIKERGMADPATLAAVAAISASTTAFLERRQQKKAYWRDLRQDLLSTASFAAENILEAIDMPMKGYHGLTAVAGDLMAGQGLQSALARGGQVAGQPIEQTAQQLGDAVMDQTGSPGLATAVHTGAMFADPF